MPAATASRRLAFAGTPEFAAVILQALIEAGHPLALVLSQPDRPAGRGRKLKPSPVKELALAAGLPVETPASLRGSAAASRMRALQIDALVVAAYGMILPDSILSVPHHGCINVHASLLPRWRGAAPIERALMAGDRETGVSIMQMDAGLDTGPVYLRRAIAISDRDTGESLHDALAGLGADALLEVLARLESLHPEPQSAGACYARKLTPADSVVDWRRPAVEIDRQIRALGARMPVRTRLGSERIRLLEAEPKAASGGIPGEVLACDRSGLLIQCGSEALRITRVQLDRGKARPLGIADLLNGYPELFRVGVVFDAAR
jgi:methionyl-tRNA formyltransferase